MYRKGVSALVLNENDEVLVVNLMTFEHHYYAIPGGGLDEGETEEDAVFREVEEELGITKDNLEVIKKAGNPIRFEFKTGPRVRNGIEYTGQERQFFALRFTGTDEDIKLAEDEVRKFAWVKFSELGDYLQFEGQLEETTAMIEDTCPFIMESEAEEVA